jgi:hypothetical protein
VTPRLRTQAALLSTGAAGLAGVVLIGIATLVFAGFDGVVTIDPQRYPGQPLPPRSYTLQLIELAQGPAYLIAAGTLGVLAGTWTRQLLLAVLGALVLFLSPVALVPRLVYDDHASAGVYGAVQVAGPLGWHFASRPRWRSCATTADRASRCWRCSASVPPSPWWSSASGCPGDRAAEAARAARAERWRQRSPRHAVGPTTSKRPYLAGRPRVVTDRTRRSPTPIYGRSHRRSTPTAR